MWVLHFLFSRRLGVGVASGALLGFLAPVAQAADATGAPPAPTTGFSIETEMFTYRALQTNTQAIACDVTAYINNTDTTNLPAGSTVCDIKSTKSATVVLMPFGSNELQDFQIWRADMATMTRLHLRSADYCTSVVAGPPGSKGAQLASSSGSAGGTAAAPKSLLSSLISASPPLSIAQSILSAMASNATATPVGGTIQDQAFMNGVARELHRLNVPVVMPTAYGPYSLVALDESVSPFLTWLDVILDDRAKCVQDALGGSSGHGGTATENRALENVAAIDGFLSTLTGEPVLAPKGALAASSPSAATTATPGKGATPAPSPAATVPPSSSHLSAVLIADGLALKLGVDPKSGTLSDDEMAKVHVLLIQALESGGSVTHTGNLFHSKVTYAGGSVGTYALFSLDGGVECSGNVYEYGASEDTKDFPTALAEPAPDPTKQMTHLRGICKPFSGSQ